MGNLNPISVLPFCLLSLNDFPSGHVGILSTRSDRAASTASYTTADEYD